MDETTGSEAMPEQAPQPAPYQAPAQPAPAPAAPQGPQEPPKRSRAWIWWTVSAVVVCLLLFSCCGITIWSAVQASGETQIVGDAVAVIRIDSAITGIGDSSLSGGSVTPDTIIEQLHQADDDADVKAIMLRIDSPGGTAAASEEIAMEVARVKKPVVVSVSDMAASGAYMVASQADLIVASPSADVGSIGVILEVGDFSEAMKKLGVKFTVLTKGKYKDVGNPFRALTPAERKLLDQDMELIYAHFIDLVAKGRKMDRKRVAELATGWAWPGVKAKELGLVDKLGNYSDALHEAARLGKIEGEPRVITYGSEDFLMFLENLTGTLRDLAPASGANPPAGRTSPILR